MPLITLRRSRSRRRHHGQRCCVRQSPTGSARRPSTSVDKGSNADHERWTEAWQRSRSSPAAVYRAVSMGMPNSSVVGDSGSPAPTKLPEDERAALLERERSRGRELLSQG